MSKMNLLRTAAIGLLLRVHAAIGNKPHLNTHSSPPFMKQSNRRNGTEKNEHKHNR